tara:strand:+ start:387 stop:524 length:138 start_codon:yes stop_codon:yes gene_type:complete
MRTFQDFLDLIDRDGFFPEWVCMTQDDCVIMSQEEFVAWLESEQG